MRVGIKFMVEIFVMIIALHKYVYIHKKNSQSPDYQIVTVIPQSITIIFKQIQMNTY